MNFYGGQAALIRSDLRARLLGAFFFAAVTAVCSQISLHLWFTPVPVTLQVLGVILSGLVLGSRWGAVSQIQYIILGTLGMPVFSGFTAGPMALVGPSGGYIFGFVLGAFVTGLVFEHLKKKTWSALWVAGIAGMVGVYILGASWLAVWLRFAGGKQWSDCFFSAWQLGIVPFIGIDILKALAASSLALGGRYGRGLLQAGRNLGW